MIDGIFVHFLVNELKQLNNLRINKFGSIKDTDFYLSLQNKKNLLFSLNSNTLNVRITNETLASNVTLPNFHKLLKKYLESSIIKEISQYNNDRIIIFDIASFDEMGYLIKIKMIFELFGRNNNLIITNDDYIIIDAYKRCFEDKNNDRLIIPKAKYYFPESDKINPFTNPNSLYNLEGVSNLLQGELEYTNSTEILYSKVIPTIIKTKTKTYFYVFDLTYLDGERIHFNTISELLDYYYQYINKEDNKNQNQLLIIDKINHEIAKINNKISKQENELLKAQENLSYEKKGNILASNLHLIKKGDKNVTLYDFYENKDIVITLDPLLSPKENLKAFFTKYQKAKRGIGEITKQIENGKADLDYYNCLLNQVKIASKNDYLEIYEELKESKVLNKEIKNNKARKTKPNFLTFKTKDGDVVLVGKNNVQNNYITHTLAKDYDYFFHVQNVPGSHVIVKTQNLTQDLITLAATIASYYSSYSTSTNVCVDYCLVKYVRKVPGMKGSFVTYKNFKSVFAKPDLDYIKNNTIN